jgi:hypothetical protein
VNPKQAHMLDMLTKARDHYGVVAIKAEFEAEGTRAEELLRLTDLTYRAGLKLALKIGGCEAITDLYAAQAHGADHVIAPMVETAYALTKFADARDKVYGRADVAPTTTRFLFNLETAATLATLDTMLPIAAARLDGIVFGRVDFTLSQGLPRDAVNSPAITEAVLVAAAAARAHDLELVVGGAVSTEAIEPLRAARAIRLDRFETRKVVFDGAFAETRLFAAGIAHAVAFELAWLEAKRDHYAAIAGEDATRIAMMRERALRAGPDRSAA